MSRRLQAIFIAAALLALSAHAAVHGATPAALAQRIDVLADEVNAHVIENRRYIHQHPELSNREFETARYVAEHLRALGIEVQTGVAKTGVVGVLRGGRPGPVVALRSELDALPVTEEVNLPFKSTVRTTYDGKQVGVMHACGHDAHMGILLGVAEVLSKLRAELPGTVKFIFQPAEEGAPAGEEGGAELMIKEGVLSNDPKPSAIFALHVLTRFESGTVHWRAGSTMAAVDDVRIVVHGKQTHGAEPWNGVDSIVIAAQIVNGLQTLISRQINLTTAPAILSIGKIDGGVRMNIIPDSVTLKGTLRTFDPAMRTDLIERLQRLASRTAEASGGTAEVEVGSEVHYPVTYNDPALTQRMLPTLRRVAGDRNVAEAPLQTVSEDFSYFQQQIPGLFVFLGVRPHDASLDDYAINHSPRFKLDESALNVGVRLLAHLAVDYLSNPASR
jgi:amidohydrolase